MKALIIEDDPIVCLTLEEQLRSFGYDVTTCTDAETALKMYQQTLYPLILLDLGLPRHGTHLILAPTRWVVRLWRPLMLQVS